MQNITEEDWALYERFIAAIDAEMDERGSVDGATIANACLNVLARTIELMPPDMRRDCASDICEAVATMRAGFDTTRPH
jgi:hypothetical protein